MSQYFIDKLVYNNDTLDIHDTEAREMINTNTTNIQALSARVTKNANDIDALENTTNVIRVDLDNVEDRVSVTEAEIDGLKTRTTSLEGKMVTVENRLDGHDTKISGLEDRMDTAENNITALDGRMTTAERDIDAAEHRLDLVEAKNSEQDNAIDSLEVNVSKNTADIVVIKDDLTGIHKDIGDLDDRITASTYEAGIGIYFGQGTEHTNINVEDEILNQINQNTIDIQNLKTRVTNVENRLTVVEGDITKIKGDITDIKAEIVNIKADITALTVRVTALEQKVLPAGGTAGQVLTKNSSTDFDAVWSDVLPRYSWQATDTFTMPTDKQFCGVIYGSDSAFFNWSADGLTDLVPTAILQATGLKDNDKVMFFKTEAFSVAWIIYNVGMTVNCILDNAAASVWILVSHTDIPAGEIVIGANGLTYTAPENRVFNLICRNLFNIDGIKSIKPSIKITYEDSTVGYETFACAYYKRFSGDELHITGLICKHNLADAYKFNVKATGDAYTPYTVTFNSATL